MPLHGEREAACAHHAKRLDQPVRRARLDRELTPEPLDSLTVEGVHAYTLLAGKRAQHPAGLERDLVRGSVLHLQWLRLIVAVIQESRYLVYFLVQGAAEGDIHLLEAPANAEHGHAGCDG